MSDHLGQIGGRDDFGLPDAVSFRKVSRAAG